MTYGTARLRSIDEDTLDATNLLIPIVGLLPADDSRVQATIDATLEGYWSTTGW